MAARMQASGDDFCAGLRQRPQIGSRIRSEGLGGVTQIGGAAPEAMALSANLFEHMQLLMSQLMVFR